MTLTLTDNIDDYDKSLLKSTFELLKYIKSKVAEDGLYRYYDDKYKLVASGSTEKKADKVLSKYIKEDKTRVGHEIGDYRYFVLISFSVARNQLVLFNKKKGGIMIYAQILTTYINDRNKISYELNDTLRNVPKKERGRVMLPISYTPSQLTKFKLSHIKKLVKSLFNRELPGSIDMYNVSKLSWFK